MMRILLLFVVGALAWKTPAIASEGWRQNTQLLPQYCKDRVKGIRSAEFQKWKGSFGEVWPHIHHYCDGIYSEQKARSTINHREKKLWLTNVIKEMQYVGRHCERHCILYPELQYRWAWALQESGQPTEAIKHLQLVIQARPKYVPAYAKLSDLYVELKQPESARRALSKGLEVKPGSRMLQERLGELQAGH